HLINIAKQRHYTLRSIPVLRLHASSDLHSGVVRIEAELLDRQHMSGTESLNAEAGIMATQALSAEQLAQLRASGVSFSGQPAPPVGGPPGSSPSSPSFPSLSSMPPNQSMSTTP